MDNQNPFADLIPKKKVAHKAAQNPFADLIPVKKQAEVVTNAPIKNGANNTLDELDVVFPLNRHMVADVLNVARDTANIPHNIDSDIPALVDPKTNYFDMLGINQNLADDVIQTGAEYAPFEGGAMRLASKIPGLGREIKNILATVGANSAFGAAANKDNRLEGAITGGEIGAGGLLLGKLADEAVVKPISKVIAQSSAVPLTEKAIRLMKKDTVSPQDAAKEFNKFYTDAKSVNDKNWKDAESLASYIDEKRSMLPNPTFKNTEYKNIINKFVKDVKGMTPSRAAPYENAFEYLPELMKIAPQSFDDLIANRQNINKVIDEVSTLKNIQANSNTKKLAKDLKNSLGTMIEKNMPKFLKDEVSQFKDVWDKANKSHGELSKFYEIPSRLGLDTSKKEMEKLLRKGGEEADGAIFDLFKPKPSQTGTGGFDHLAELVGERNAKKYLKSYMLRNVDKGNAIDALKIFHKLSPEQKKAIFGNSKEGQVLEKASKIWREIGKDQENFFDHMPWWHGIGKMSVPGAGIAGLSLLEGLPWPEAAALGAGSTAALLAGAKGAGKLAPSTEWLAPLGLDIAKTTTRTATEGRKHGGKLTAITLQDMLNRHSNDDNR